MVHNWLLAEIFFQGSYTFCVLKLHDFSRTFQDHIWQNPCPGKPRVRVPESVGLKCRLRPRSRPRPGLSPISYRSLHFRPSLQSAFYTDRFLNICERLHLHCQNLRPFNFVCALSIFSRISRPGFNKIRNPWISRISMTLTNPVFMNSRWLTVDRQNNFIETLKIWRVRIFILYSDFFCKQCLKRLWVLFSLFSN